MDRTLLGGAALIMILLATAGGGAWADTVADKAPKVPLETARANDKGNGLVREGKFEEAVEAYRPEALKRPENGILQRNLAGALVRSQQVEEGFAAYSQALRFAADPAEKAKVLYDLGNSLAVAGQFQPALETYAQAMFLAPDDLDIKHNFEFLMKMMQEQEQEQQQPQDQGQENPEEGEQGDQQDQEQQPQPEDQEAQDSPQPQEGENPEEQPAPEQQQQPDAESMDPEDAQRLLDALLEEEKELQAERMRQRQLEVKNVEKDW